MMFFWVLLIVVAVDSVMKLCSENTCYCCCEFGLWFFWWTLILRVLLLSCFTSDFSLLWILWAFNDEFSSEMLVFEFLAPSSDFLNVGFDDELWSCLNFACLVLKQVSEFWLECFVFLLWQVWLKFGTGRLVGICSLTGFLAGLRQACYACSFGLSLFCKF